MPFCVLQFLSFEESDDGLGIGTLDALASVLPEQLPAVQAEVHQVLIWAKEHWGEPDTYLEDGYQGTGWFYELQVHQEVIPNQPSRTLLSLTVSAPTMWCNAMLAAFVDDSV